MTNEWLVVSAVLVAVAAGARGTWSPCGLSMVSAINPLSERSRGNRYWLTCAWFVAGAVAGGLLLGAVASAAALALRPVLGGEAVLAASVGAVAALVCLAADAELGGFRLPLHPRQVNERWLDTYRRWIYAAGFGAQIGAGFATYVMTAATYLVVALAALTASPVAALAVGALFGLVRGSAVLLTAGVREPAALLGLHRRLERFGPASLTAVMAVQAVVAVALAAAGFGVAGAVPVTLLVLVVAVTRRAVSLRPGRARALAQFR